MKTINDYLQTDGSLETMQYGRQVDDFAWEYKEVDQQYKSEEEAIADFENWRTDTIDMREYAVEKIEDAISTFGYKLLSFSKTDPEQNSIEQGGDIYESKDSIQLICECLFELEY